VALTRLGGAVALVLTVGMVAGCGRDSGPAGVATSAAIVVASPSAALDDPPGANTCHLLVGAITNATLMEPGVVDAIVAAGATADAPVADSAQRLLTAYTAAVASNGTPDEPDKIAAVSKAGADMSGVCDDSGLESVG
jgi:hypothetical protein